MDFRYECKQKGVPTCFNLVADPAQNCSGHPVLSGRLPRDEEVMRKNRFTEALLVTTLRKADEMPSHDEAWRERSDDLHATQAFRVNGCRMESNGFLLGRRTHVEERLGDRESS